MKWQFIYKAKGRASSLATVKTPCEVNCFLLRSGLVLYVGASTYII